MAEERRLRMKTSPEEPDDYPIELMGEHPDLEFILDYKIKSSRLREVNSEDGCAGTEV